MSERAGEQTMSDERAGRLEAALIECAALSGEDMDGDETRAPTWPPVEVWAVRCVKELREAYDEALSEGSAQRAGEGEAGQDFSRAWSAAVEHGLVDEFADDLDGEESKLRAFLGQLGGVAGPASAEGRRANSGDDSSQGLPDSATAWKSGAPGATGTPSTCLGCGMPVGKAHADDCPYARSRRVNSMQTRIAPVRESAQRAGEPTPERIERVAKAICEATSVVDFYVRGGLLWDDLKEDERDFYRAQARAAPDAARPEGER